MYNFLKSKLPPLGIMIIIMIFSLNLSKAASFEDRDFDKEPRHIEEVLKEISEKYQVFFAYNISDVKNSMIDFECYSDETLNEVIERFITVTNLRYEILNDQFCVIFKNDKKGQRNKKKLHKKINQIQKIETNGKVSLRVNNGQNSSSDKLKSLIAFNQQEAKITVNGIVKDELNEPLIGVNVQIKGEANGTVTDYDGSYSLEVEDEAILIFSYIGYIEQEVAVNKQTQIDVVLKENVSDLEEVVVIGYGTAKKQDVTGSVAKVENLKNRSVTNVEEALQGNVAGLTVVGDGGDPTSVPKISIRGVGSLSDESPLWVVDGVPYYGAPLNPYDIESMTVLKDAASTAIYGVKAAGGVILVTTKKGRKGKLDINLNAYTGVQNIWRKPEALNAAQQAEYYNLSDDNTGKDRDPLHDASVNPDGQITRTDWVDEIFRTGVIQNYDIGISGGSDRYTFASSLGYNERTGTLLNTKANRVSLRFNSSFKINDKIRVGENISYTRTNGNSAFTGTQAANGETNYNGIIAQAIKAPPHVPVYDENGNYSDMPAAGYGLTIHPVATLERINIENPVTDLFGNLYAEVDILKNLKLRSAIGINLKNGLYKEFTPRVPEASKTTSSINSLEIVNFSQTDWSWENTITFTPKIGTRSTLTALGGYTQQSYSYDLQRIIGENFQNEDANSRYLVNAGNYRILKEEDGLVSNFQENRLISFFGRLNYGLDSKYLISASVRTDGSSKLGKDNRWGVFPAVSLAWQLSEEDFIKDISIIDALKLRSSWGRIGNITSLSNYPTNVPLTSTAVILGGVDPINGFALDGISNPNIAWETSEQLNFGVDASLFDYKFSLNADYFIKNTFDLIVPLPITSLAGVNNFPYVNAGQVENKGIELGLTYKKLDGDLTYSFTGNVAAIKNRLVALEEGITKILDNTQVATHFPLESAINEPLLSFYLIESDGIFQSDAEAEASVQPNAVAGDLRFVDQNNDGKIDDLDKVYKGNAFPDFTYGFNAKINYKNFDLSMFLQGTKGAVAYNGFKITTVYPAQTSVSRANLSAEAQNTWSPNNTGAELFRLSDNDPNDNLRPSDFWLESTDYLRLKNLTLGYNFNPTDKIKNLRVYVSAQNLFTITKYSGLDPEVANKGIDGGQYPIGRIILFGVNMGL